jgi:hypothetical protein
MYIPGFGISRTSALFIGGYVLVGKSGGSTPVLASKDWAIHIITTSTFTSHVLQFIIRF